VIRANVAVNIEIPIYTALFRITLSSISPTLETRWQMEQLSHVVLRLEAVVTHTAIN
jgi:hypothetical protein